MVNAKKTIETKYTVRQNLDQQQLYHDMEGAKMANLQKYIEYSREVQQARKQSTDCSIKINNYFVVFSTHKMLKWQQQ